MKYKLLIAPVFCFVFLYSCTDDKNDSGTLSDKQKQLQNEVVNLQKNSYSLLASLQQEMDSLEAIDSVVAVINSDPSVDWARSNKQGIAIQYKSGIKGGILINYGIKNIGNIDLEDSLKSMSIKEMNSILKTTNPRKFPPVKRSVYVSPVHESHGYDEEITLLSVETYLTTTDYNDFKSILNKDATVEWFTTIDEYGIIVISSVGFNINIDENNTETFLLTGETVNESTSSKFWNDINNGSVPLIYIAIQDDDNYYWIGPGFISKYNDLAKDTAFIYGGFDNSYLGTWSGIMGPAGNKFGGYMGYEGTILLEAHYSWLTNFIYNLTDIASHQSMTCDDWINGTTIKKSVYNPTFEEYFKIKYDGIPDLAFTEKEVPLYNYCILKARVRGRSLYFDQSTSYDPVFFGDKKVTGAFIDDKTFEANFHDDTYTIELRINGDFGTNPVITDIYYHCIKQDYDTYTEHIVASDIRFNGFYRSFGGVEFNMTAESTCDLFTQVNFDVRGGDGMYTRELTSYECDEDSYFNIVLGVEVDE